MLWLVLSTLRHRKAGFAGAFVALLCAAALVCACGVLLDTGLRGSVAPERYAGSPVVVTGDQFVHKTFVKKKGKVKHKAKTIAERAWLPESVADRVRNADGVRGVVTEVTFPAEIGGSTGGARESWGHGWESAALTPFTIRDGRAPGADDEIVIDAATARAKGLRPGATVEVSSAVPGRYRVVGVTAQALDHQTAVFFSTAQARRLSGRDGMVTAIGAHGPRKAVEDAVRGTGATVHTGADRGRAEFLGAERSRIKLISLGGALGGTALLVAILVVAGTFALSVQQRDRELALLRAVAATPRQVRRMIGREALLVGLLAGPLGAAAGLPLAVLLRDRFRGLGALPPNLDLVVSPFPPAAAALAAVAAAFAAARITGRRTARIRPVEALGDAAPARGRLGAVRIVAGLAVAAGAAVLTAVLSGLHTEAASSPVTVLTAIVWTVAVALLGPAVVRGAVAVLAVPLRLSPVGGHLAAANLGAGARRVASVVAPLTLMTGLTATILFAQTTMGHAATRQATEGTIAAHVLGPRVPHATADRIRRAPGVTAVTEVVHSTVRVDLENYAIQGVTPEGLNQTMDLDVREGSLRNLDPSTIAVSRTAADRLGVLPGERLRLDLGDGTPIAPTVIAVYGRGLGFGDLTVSRDLLAAHVDDPRGTLLIAGTPPAGLPVTDAAALAEAGADANAEVNLVAMALILAFTAIAVVNTLAMSTAGRAREFALLRLVGTTRRQIMRMLGWETLAVVAVAGVLGTAIAFATLTAFGRGMTGGGAHVPPLGLLGVLAWGGVLAGAATVLPAWTAMAARPADALGARD
ncbi:ABC transporter permease [Actinomadura decatromicini]|uniref:ABC transporter permease n=1 Tax=Actinomadura decatromicini TaxID=2604572 RepID=A0A5D3FZ19_9ACTN|nr:FtsX-like permease family protein [Actinomadura decatromicini]TYK53258.1 ABC transporter permease [Actinomadura decatromicini]